MHDRLKTALQLIGYDHAQQMHNKTHLIEAIALFASTQCDKELQTVCAQEMDRIRAAFTATLNAENTEYYGYSDQR